jgi:hypothetical protein
VARATSGNWREKAPPKKNTLHHAAGGIQPLQFVRGISVRPAFFSRSSPASFAVVILGSYGIVRLVRLRPVRVGLAVFARAPVRFSRPAVMAYCIGAPCSYQTQNGTRCRSFPISGGPRGPMGICPRGPNLAHRGGPMVAKAIWSA